MQAYRARSLLLFSPFLLVRGAKLNQWDVVLQNSNQCEDLPQKCKPGARSLLLISSFYLCMVPNWTNEMSVYRMLTNERLCVRNAHLERDPRRWAAPCASLAGQNPLQLKDDIEKRWHLKYSMLLNIKHTSRCKNSYILAKIASKQTNLGVCAIKCVGLRKFAKIGLFAKIKYAAFLFQP
jgi:hypothetical protein